MKFKRKRLSRILASALVTVLGLSAVAISVSAKSTVVAAGNLILTLEGRISPQGLSRTKLTPITFHFGAKVKTKDGKHAPAAEVFEAEIDRNGAINTKGLAVCRTGQLEARPTAAAEKACKDALVGRGFAEAEVEFPEQAPFDARGPLLMFNGGTRGGTTLVLVHVYANVPAPTAFVTPVYVSRINHGRYGLKIKAKIPVIAGGSGSLSRLAVTSKKTFTYKNRKQSYLLAKCPTGILLGRGNLSFSDGTRLIGTVTAPCTPKG
jgi:hypothetical protein